MSPVSPGFTGRLTWQLAGVVEIKEETARTKSLELKMPDWPGR
jgi:hypothetical protein